MAIIQPENKTLLVQNNSGLSVNLDSTSDVVRGNASQPSNGEYFYEFVTDDKVVVKNNTFVSSPISVVTDGSTYNDDLAGKGIDIVFQAESSTGNQVQVIVLNTVGGKDTHIRNQSGQDLNHGGMETNEAGVQTSVGHQSRALIKFDVSVLGFINLKVIDSMVMFWMHDDFSPSGDIFVMHEISAANTDWVEGTATGSVQPGSSSWNHKRSSFLPWAGSAGLSTVDVDRSSAVLSSLSILNGRNLWIFFRSNDGILNNAILRWMKNSVNNSGILIKHIDESTARRIFRFRPADYTADITLRPKIIILLEGIDTQDGGVFPNYPTSMGSEITFGGA